MLVTSRLRLLLLGLSFAGLGATGAMAQKIGGAVEADVPLWRVVAAFLLCSGLVIVAALALRTRLKGSAPLFSQAPRRLQLLESSRVSHQTDVCLMACDGKEFIVAVSPHGVTFHPGLPGSRPARKRATSAEGQA